MDLNKIKIWKDHGKIDQNDFSIVGDDKQTEVYFKNIEKHIIEKIKKYNNVVGCIAWLTNNNILKELSKKKTVLIIIQEEDFLRPDSKFDGQKEKWKNKIFKLYDKIENLNNIYLGYYDVNICSGDVPSGIRRVGLINKDKLPAFPRMHNKFLICYDNNNDHINIKKDNYVSSPFFTYDIEENNSVGVVLTGSYNYTENSNNSFENVVCIKDNIIVHQYFKQFVEISVLSVSLDWEKDWTPDAYDDRRYGT